MKLLVVLAYSPFPPRVGGAVIAYNNIKELAKKHSVCVLCRDVCREPESIDLPVEKVEFVRPEKHSKFFMLSRNVFYLFFGFPFIITGFSSREMEKRVRELDESEKYDAILLYGIEAVQYCSPLSYKKVIVNVEDPQSIKNLRLMRLPINSIWEKTKLWVHMITLIHYENRVLPKMAKVALLSEADLADMQEQRKNFNLGFVPYGVDQHPSENIESYDQRAENMIVFSGSMYHIPNVDGALFFLKDIFPFVLRDYPATILWIVGAEPDVRIRDAATRFGIHVVITGRIKDMSKFLKNAKVSVCPVRLKIGVQTKILEALSWGTPVVTTRAGNSGVGGLSGSELWVEDDPRLFAGRVVELLRGKNWKQLSERGQQLASERFSWKRSASELEQHIIRIQTAGL